MRGLKNSPVALSKFSQNLMLRRQNWGLAAIHFDEYNHSIHPIKIALIFLNRRSFSTHHPQHPFDLIDRKTSPISSAAASSNSRLDELDECDNTNTQFTQSEYKWSDSSQIVRKNQEKQHVFEANTIGQEAKTLIAPLPSLKELQFSGEIPRDSVDISFSLASGPGGQNVNKNPTKAEIRFQLGSADWLPEILRERIRQRYKGHCNKRDEFILTSMRTRDAKQNQEDCFEKLQSIIRECSEDLILEYRLPTKEDQDILTKRAERADQYRRAEKTWRSNKKRFRTQPL